METGSVEQLTDIKLTEIFADYVDLATGIMSGLRKEIHLKDVKIADQKKTIRKLYLITDQS